MRACSSLVTLVLLIAGAGLQLGCSSGPPQQKTGTPAFYWSAAKENYAAGDFAKAVENLERAAATENEYSGRAQVWLLILTSGQIRGRMDLADGLEAGVRAKKADPGGFRKYITNSRSTAGRESLQFAEAFMRFQKTAFDPVALDFNYPSGSAAPVPELTKAMTGVPLQPADIEAAQRRSIQRSILLETCRAVGAPDDTAKAAGLFQSGTVEVSRAGFLQAMGNALYDQSQLYTSSKLDDPNKLKMFAKLAAEAIEGLPESKDTKDLKAKVEKALKK
jgi:hypothetical protein